MYDNCTHIPTKSFDYINLALEKDSGTSMLIDNAGKMKECRDNHKTYASPFTDLSKIFDCLLHDLLFARLNAFGFD